MKKYELTPDFKMCVGRKLFQVKALVSFGSVSPGELGGWIEKKENLSQEGDCWVYDNAWVYGNAQVAGNARVYGNAQVAGNARVYGNAWVFGNAWVSSNARVFGNARVYGNAWVSGNAQVHGNVWVFGNTQASGNVRVFGDARVFGNAWVCGDARVHGNAWVSGNAHHLLVGQIGSRSGFTTFYRNKDKGITVSCGYFLGTLAEFRAKVIETHGTDSKYSKVYQVAADLAEVQIDLSGEEDDCNDTDAKDD